ncbi:hypothetical protein [Bartonella birtlesii]|uniref:Uncharacterized protein n=1 Tax=Bartonella birtlesii LL-WM9 TaxID=1094552 RepID=J1IXE4_9HYPH|nr:hypothetical protein [Bartonella birtlesii]EJF76347.1 hypothetical protein ME7_00891 [Bartonella birtlesii LL-WM9]
MINFYLKKRKLAKFPTLGRLCRVVNTRELVIHTNYIVVYDLSNDVVRKAKIHLINCIFIFQSPEIILLVSEYFGYIRNDQYGFESPKV